MEKQSFANKCVAENSKSNVFMVFISSSDMVNSYLRVYFQTSRLEDSRERYSIKVFEVKLDSAENNKVIKPV